MDTSREYILMCKKAVEVQELWKPEEGDYYINPIGLVNVMKKGWHGRNANWLPRQDQLQDMIIMSSTSGTPFSNRCMELCEKLFIFTKDCYYLLMSMEQLWLAFVMSEKFNKVWTGTDWKPKGE